MLQFLAFIAISLIYGCNSYLYESRAIPAAIVTRRSVDVRDVPNTFKGMPSSDIIEVKANKMSFLFILKSASSNINVIHKHESAKVPPLQHSNSIEEPHILSHTVNKPIIQEVREVISPFRHVIQEIRPVTEEIKTIVSTKSGNSGNSGNSVDHKTILNTNSGHQKTTKQPNYEQIFDRKPLMQINTNNIKDCPLFQNMVDYKLYSGTSEYDMKYKSNDLMDSNNYLLYQMIKLYKDKK